MPNLKENQVDSEAPSFKEKFKAKLKSLKPYAALSKAVIVSSVSVSLIVGLGYLAVATNYPGTIDIQIPNALTLKIQNQNK